MSLNICTQIKKINQMGMHNRSNCIKNLYEVILVIFRSECIINKKTCILLKEAGLFAGPTRLELATSALTGQRSNQLSYDPGQKLCAI